MSESATMNWRRAVVYFAWGSKYLNEAVKSAESVRILDLPTILITDYATADQPALPTGFDRVVAVDLKNPSLLTKSGLWRHLPDEFDSFLFLDSDTIVLMDLMFGFERAEQYGIAASPAPHYSLDHFWDFDMVLDEVGISKCSQLQYNTGTLFFVRRPDVQAVFEKWTILCQDFGHLMSHPNDQPFFTLAMELSGFNPYTLSPAYNYRALGELISGYVRVWHSHHPVPPELNSFGKSWPPRRYLNGKEVPYLTNREKPFTRLKKMMKRFK